MSTLVLTGYDSSEFEQIGDKTTSGKRAWAARRGYEFECVREYEGGSHPSWQKLRFLEERLPDHKQIIWLDADTVITNPNISLEMLLESVDRALVVSRDWGAHSENDRVFHFSMGNFVIRNTASSLALIAAAKRHVHFQNAHLWDQSAIQQVLREDPEVRSSIAILPRRVFNAVPEEIQSSAPEPWQKRDFLAHLTGTSNSIRLAAIDRYNLENVDCCLNLAPYEVDAWNIGISIDKRHAACLRDLLIGRRWHNTLEIGCHYGCSSVAFVEALNRGTIKSAHFSDIQFYKEFYKVISHAIDSSKIALHERQGHEVINGDVNFDLIFVDGNHTLAVVKKETQAILRKMPECIVAHDINSRFVGFPECDGPPFLLKELQSAGYLCLIDLQDRPGEMTKRGLLMACKSQEAYQVALAAYQANCW